MEQVNVLPVCRAKLAIQYKIAPRVILAIPANTLIRVLVVLRVNRVTLSRLVSSVTFVIYANSTIHALVAMFVKPV